MERHDEAAAGEQPRRGAGRWLPVGRLAVLGALAWLVVSPVQASASRTAAPAVQGPGPVGPIALAEHLAWFAVLSLFVFLVYHALRVDSISAAARHGVKRWLVFVAGSAVLALVSGLLAAWL